MHPQLLVVGHVWPEPQTTAAGNRMVQLLDAFLFEGYRITFACAASKTKHSHDLSLMGVKEQPILLNDSSFDDWIISLQPQIVVFDRFMVEEQYGWRVATHCPDALRVLNTEDLHSLRDYREFCVKKQLVFSTDAYIAQDKTKRELASIYRSDVSLLVSTFEKDFLENTLGIPAALLIHLPFMLPTIDAVAMQHWVPFKQRQHFICFGNGYHAPNRDAFKYLKTAIWPLIKKELPTAELHIYGAYLPQQSLQLHQPKTGFFVHGWVQDLAAEVAQARVLLAPLRFGAGIKGKLALAMQGGTPSITTAIGAEGMGDPEQWPGHVTAQAAAFAARAVSLYQDKTSWHKAQTKITPLFNKTFSKSELAPRFFKRIAALRANLEQHRNQNLVGAILQHQSMAATKYMAKWIEAKNKP